MLTWPRSLTLSAPLSDDLAKPLVTTNIRTIRAAEGDKGDEKEGKIAQAFANYSKE